MILQKYKTGSITIDKIPTLKQVQELYGESLENMVSQLDHAFARKNGDRPPNTIFHREEVCDMLGITDEVLAKQILSANTQVWLLLHSTIFERAVLSSGCSRI